MTQDPTDSGYRTRLDELRASIRKLTGRQPAPMKAFAALHQSALASGALDTKTKELIALAIAVAARCDGCIAYHTYDALRAGAGADEISETLSVAVLMGGGTAMVYATQALEAMEQFEGEFDHGNHPKGVSQ